MSYERAQRRYEDDDGTREDAEQEHCCMCGRPEGASACGCADAPEGDGDE